MQTPVKDLKSSVVASGVSDEVQGQVSRQHDMEKGQPRKEWVIVDMLRKELFELKASAALLLGFHIRLPILRSAYSHRHTCIGEER